MMLILHEYKYFLSSDKKSAFYYKDINYYEVIYT